MCDKKDLLDKIHKEEEEFIRKMMLRSPAEIIDAAYEITYRKEIICLLETSFLWEEQKEKLYNLPYPISSCYDAWMDWDGDCLRDAIEYFLEEDQ